MDKYQTRILWQDTTDGTRGVYEVPAELEIIKDCRSSPVALLPLDLWDGWNTYWWTDGNGGCDCNRGSFFRGIDCPCGGTRFVISIEVLDDDVWKTIYTDP